VVTRIKCELKNVDDRLILEAMNQRGKDFALRLQQKTVKAWEPLQEKIITCGISRAVASLMQEGVVSVESGATVSQVVELMAQKGVRNVFVMNMGIPIGLIRDWDIVRRLVATKLNQDTVKVNELMCTPVASVNSDAELPEIAAVMAETGARRILVMQGEKVIGTITAGRLLNTLSHFPDSNTREVLKSIAGLR
jgi:predicted transcriptional regulator